MQKKEQQLHQLVNSLKYKFFKVIYLILKDWSPYKWITILVCFVQYLQYTYLNFGLKVQYVWNNKAYSDMMNLLLKYFTITISVKNLGINTYLAIFYLCLGLVVITIILFLLLAFVITNKKLQTFPLILLRFLLKIILTFGFWPIVRMQFGLLACEYNKKGKFIMMFETSQECWTSEYYIHAIIAIIGLIITLSFSVTLAFVTYESRKVANDSSAMRNGRSYASIMIYQLLATPSYTFIIILVFLIGSSSIFFNAHIVQPYYDTLIQKMWSILSGVNLWTIIMMLYAFVIEGHTFNNSIKCWLLGIPLIIGILVLRQREQIDLMVVNLKKIEDGQQIIKLCEYLLLLIEESQKCQRSQLLLDSYLELHREVCNKVNCVVKLKQELASKFKDNPKYTDRAHITKELILQIYKEGIKQFPEDIPLRMSFIYFLYEEKKPFSILMAELTQAMEFKPTLDYEFHIYRYKTIVEEEFQLKAEQFDITSQQKSIKDLIDLLEYTGLQLIDFWISLTEDIPDMQRLMGLGFKILKLRENIESSWQKLKNTHSIKLYFNMLKFYQFCFDDLEVSEKIQNELWKIQKSKQQELSELEEVCNQSCPTLVSTANFQDVQVYIANKAFCSALGFSKTDLIGRSINQIIPEIFIKKHNLCVEYFIENKISKMDQVINQTVYLMTKSNYIVPMYVQVKLLQANNGQLYFISQFLSNFSPKQQCILILDNDGYIQHISSSCITFLKLDTIKIQIKRINIKDFFSDFMQRKVQLLSKGGARLHLIPPGLKYSTKTLDTTSIYEQNEFQCYVQPIQYPCLEDLGTYGLVVRLELIKQSQQNDQSILKLYPLKMRKTVYPNFSYAPPTTFYLEYQNVVTEFEESFELSNQQDNGTKLTRIVDYFRMVKRMSAPQKQSVLLDDGIKTKRLWEGQLLDVEEFEVDEGSENTDQVKQVLSEKEKQNEVQEIQHYFELFQSKQSMYDILISSNISKSQKVLNVLIKFSILILYISGFIVFMFNKGDDTQVSDLIFKLSLNNRRLSSCLMIQTVLQDLRLLNQKAVANLRNDIDYYIAENLYLLNLEVLEIQDIHNSLSQAQYTINEQYKEYEIQYNSADVTLFQLDGTSSNFTYKEAMEQVIAKAIILNSGNQNKYNDQDMDFYYFNYNTMNTIIQQYKTPLNYIYYSIKSVTTNSLENKVIFLILQSIVQLITYVLLAFYLTLYNSSLHQLYYLFLEVNSRQIKGIVQKCEQFLSLVNVGDEDEEENVDTNQQKIQNEQDQYDFNPNKKHKKHWKNSNTQFINMMILLLFVFGFFQAYFVYQYISAQQIVEDTENLSPILNTTSLLESKFRFGDNAVREYFMNPTKSIFTNPNPQKFLNNYFNIISDINADMQTMFTQNTYLFQQDFISAFQQLYVDNPCPIVSQQQTFITQEKCETFYNGVVSEGLSVGLVKLFENLNIMLLTYEGYITYFDGQNLDSITKQNLLYYNAILLQNTTVSMETRMMQKIVIRYSQSYLITKLEQSIKDSFNQLSITRTVLFVCFSFYMFVIVFLLWIPSNKYIITQLRKSRTMLLTMPMEILTNSIPIRRYIREILKN